MEVVNFKEQPQLDRLGFLMLVIIDRVGGRLGSIGIEALDDFRDGSIDEFCDRIKFADRCVAIPSTNSVLANSDRFCYGS